MNKAILVSLSTIALVSAVVVGATSAYFTDTETSTNNIFEAGQINLEIDLERDGVVIFDLKDLDGDKFFDYCDRKPGDNGEATISLRVYNNNAWGRLHFYNKENLENLCNEPETKVPDTSCGTGIDQGELGQYLKFYIWVDDGDNVWETCEPELYHGTADNLTTTYIAYPGEMIGGQHYYIGMNWCIGDMTLVPGSGITCDGSGVGNIAQTDSFEFDIDFEVVQSRNNSGKVF